MSFSRRKRSVPRKLKFERASQFPNANGYEPNHNPSNSNCSLHTLRHLSLSLSNSTLLDLEFQPQFYMASNNPDLTKTPKRRSNTSRKVRVVAKIGGFADPEAELSSGYSWISVNKPTGEASEGVALSFREQSAR